MSYRGSFAAAWTSLAAGSRAATVPSATTTTDTERWTTSKRRAGCQAMAAAQGRRTRPLEGRAAGPQPPCDAPGAGTNAVVPRGRGAALEAGGAPPRRAAPREESGYASG